MSVFASDTQVTLTIPGTDHSVTIRKLSRRQFMKLIGSGDEMPHEALKVGVVGWTLDKPFSPEALDDLDFDTSEFIGSEVLYLAKPSLRLGANAEAEQKNV